MEYTLENLYGMQDKAVIITGGTSGIGLEVARAVLDLGGRAAVVGVGDALTETAKQELEQRKPGRVYAHTLDVTDNAQVEAVFAEIANRFGQIDGLVNCAGINRIEPLHAMDLEQDFLRVADVDALGTVRCCRAAGQYMLRRNYGRIVNISSLSCTRGKSFYTAYCYSKAAVCGFTRALAVEWAKNGITVNAVAPGMIVTDINRRQIEANPESFAKRTESIPRGCPGRAEWLIAPIVMLLSDGAPHLTGQTIYVDGGSSIGDTFIMEKEKQGALKID